MNTEKMHPFQSENTSIQMFSHLSDDEWFQTLIDSITTPSSALPGFPPQYRQEVFVGKSNDVALKEAFDFYRLIKSRATPLKTTSTILDFGVGWGRIIRFFAKDVEGSNLYGVDVDSEILEESRTLGVPGKLLCIEPKGNLSYSESFFDVIYAFSVFSHLSEDSAKHWLRELMRVLKPGGTLVLTTTTDWFLNLCLACHMKKKGRGHHEEIYANLFKDPHAALEAYRNGSHVYTAVGGASEALIASNYGWAAMPLQFVEREIGKITSAIEFIDDSAICEQGIFIIKKCLA